MKDSSDPFTAEICKICFKVAAKYTCPKCNLRYCSLTCYRHEKHLQCSEKFYKDCCIEQMKLQRGSKEDKEKMMEILKRVQEDDQSFDDPCSNDTVKSLEERLNGLDLDNDVELVWDQLTGEEREEFQKMLRDGRISHLMDSYTPWWKCEPCHVVELSSTTDMSTPINAHPPIPANLPPLNSLLKVQPSPLLKYNVINILYSYAYVIRLFNGSHMELLEQAVETLYKLSAVLYASTVFHDCNSAINDVITRSQQDKCTTTSLEFAYGTMSDVSCIISGGSHEHSLVSHALSDVHYMIQVRCDQMKIKGARRGVVSGKTLREVERKSFFLLVWSREYCHEILPLQRVVDLEHEEHLKELWEHREMESKIKKSRTDNKKAYTPSKTSQLIKEL